MKHLLFAVFENSAKTSDLIQVLSESGFNGTVLMSTSLKHFYHTIESDHSLLTLRHFDRLSFEDNTTFYAILDDKNLVKAQEIIRERTKHFEEIKGGMFVIPVENYEGSF